MKKFISFSLAIVMLVSFSVVPALAADVKSNEKKIVDYVTVDIEDILDNSAIDLGTDDPDAIITDAIEPDPYAPLTRTSPVLFSFTGSNIKNLLTTASTQKTFTRSSLTEGNLRISGRGSYDYPTDGLTFRVGECFYDSGSGTYISYYGQHIYCENDTYSYESLPKSNFSSEYVYYGFMRNLSGSNTNTLQGTFYFANTSY